MSTPYARGSDTSYAAARSMDDSAEHLRQRVLSEIRRQGKHGATCDEIEVTLDLRHQTASARVHELMRDERIVDSGDRRLTRSGRKAVVWVESETKGMAPILKWPGGKRWLLPRLIELYAPYRDHRLVEPFVGGMSVALGLQPQRAWLADVNPHLINFYGRLRDSKPFTVAMENKSEVYYAARERFNRLIAVDVFTTEAAELFYYLNRTGFNGLCRFNKSGEFNVPFGKYKKINYRRDFSEYTRLMREWVLACGSFERWPLYRDDFVYLDPPYDCEFVEYAGNGFSWDDQVRLVEKYARHPGPVVASNEATPRIVELYQCNGFAIELIEAPRRISANGDRTPTTEMLAVKNLTKGVAYPQADRIKDLTVTSNTDLTEYKDAHKNTKSDTKSSTDSIGL